MELGRGEQAGGSDDVMGADDAMVLRHAPSHIPRLLFCMSQITIALEFWQGGSRQKVHSAGALVQLAQFAGK